MTLEIEKESLGSAKHVDERGVDSSSDLSQDEEFTVAEGRKIIHRIDRRLVTVCGVSMCGQSSQNLRSRRLMPRQCIVFLSWTVPTCHLQPSPGNAFGSIPLSRPIANHCFSMTVELELNVGFRYVCQFCLVPRPVTDTL